jgi:hypothetical protein
MTRVEMLRAELKDAHESLEGTMADVTQELLDRMPAGIANPIGERYAHHATAEDSLVNLIVRGEAPLMSSTWQGRTGISEPRFGSDPQYARTVRVRLVRVRDYARAVYAQSDAYLASLRDADLDRVIDMTPLPFGKVPVWWILARLVVAHAYEVNGEVAAVKGVLGVRGFPY